MSRNGRLSRKSVCAEAVEKILIALRVLAVRWARRRSHHAAFAR
jgi:hypothetical protein